MPNYPFAKYEVPRKLIRVRDSKTSMTPLECVPHLHNELELVYYFGGKTTAYVDASRYELHPGDVFLSFPNQIHWFETHAREQYLLFIISPDLLPEFATTFTQCIPISPIVTGVNERNREDTVMRLLMEYCSDTETDQLDRLLLRGMLLTLFADLLKQIPMMQSVPKDCDALKSIVSYCSAHFDEDLSLTVLEEKVHLNKYYISHLFSNRLGLRFNEYVNSLRISEACKYLLYSGRSIIEISESVGFNTPRTFNRAFIRQIGMSPSEYRKQASFSARRT